MITAKDRLKAAILEKLAAPEEVETDSGRVKNQSVSQMLKAYNAIDRLDVETSGDGQFGRLGFRKLRHVD